MQIELIGMHDLFRGLEKFEKEVVQTASVCLEQEGMDIIEESKDNLRRNGSVATGFLMNSGKVQKVQDNGYDVGFMGGESYASAVEYGRRAGKMPPIDYIVAWLKKKHSRSLTAATRFFGDKSAQSALRQQAYLIARAIGKFGTRPHPFFVPVVKKHERSIQRSIQMAVQSVITKYSS